MRIGPKQITRAKAIDLARQAANDRAQAVEATRQIRAALDTATKLAAGTQAVLSDVIGCAPDRRLRLRGFVRVWPFRFAVRFAKLSTIDEWRSCVPPKFGGPPVEEPKAGAVDEDVRERIGRESHEPADAATS